MPQRFSIEIDKIVEFLGIEKDHRSRQGASSYQVKCPFCDDRKYHMNINTGKNAYSCVHCGQAGGALDLYGRVAHNTPLIPGKKKDGGNGNVLFSRLCKDLYGSDNRRPVIEQKKPDPCNSEIRRSCDEIVHNAYLCVLQFPHFQLSEQHQKNLIKRGLQQDIIQKNEYRTIPEDMSWVFQYPELIEEFAKLRLEKECRTYSVIEKTPLEALQAGFIVGRYLQQNNICMEGVPGFYNIRGHWLFKLETGMLIPTRNPYGLIVGMQARKDKGDIRYKTISSKDLPLGVTEGITRVHFPLNNVKAEPGVNVYLTEGPLKADVASYLLGESSFFIAVQGVQNTKEFPTIFNWLKERGVTTILNMLDMDKLTNPNVAKASRKMKQLAQEYGMALQMYGWDEDYAWRKFLQLYVLCIDYKIEVPLSRNIFVDLATVAELLTKAKVPHSIRKKADGSIVKDYWNDDSKGIDDWLYHQKIGKEKS